jgi:hypothetical protein
LWATSNETSQALCVNILIIQPHELSRAVIVETLVSQIVGYSYRHVGKWCTSVMCVSVGVRSVVSTVIGVWCVFGHRWMEMYVCMIIACMIATLSMSIGVSLSVYMCTGCVANCISDPDRYLRYRSLLYNACNIVLNALLVSAPHRAAHRQAIIHQCRCICVRGVLRTVSAITIAHCDIDRFCAMHVRLYRIHMSAPLRALLCKPDLQWRRGGMCGAPWATIAPRRTPCSGIGPRLRMQPGR